MKDPTPPNMSVDDILLGVEHWGDPTKYYGDELTKGQARVNISVLFDTFAERVIGLDTTGVSQQTEALNLLRELQRSRVSEIKKELGL